MPSSRLTREIREYKQRTTKWRNRLFFRGSEKITAWFFHVVLRWHSIEHLYHEVANSVGLGYLAHGDERAETVHGDRPLIFNSVAGSICCCFRFSNKSALVVTRILMAILISNELTIGLKSEQGGR